MHILYVILPVVLILDLLFRN